MKETALFKKLKKNIKAPYDPESVAKDIYLRDRVTSPKFANKEDYTIQKAVESLQDSGITLDDVIEAKTLSEMKDKAALENELQQSKSTAYNPLSFSNFLKERPGEGGGEPERYLSDLDIEALEEEAQLKSEAELEDYYDVLRQLSDKKLNRWKAGEDIRGEFNPYAESKEQLEKTTEDIQGLWDLKQNALRGLAGKK